MKRYKALTLPLLFFLLSVQMATAQTDSISLVLCFKASDKHLPFAKRAEAYQSLHDLQSQIIRTTWFPSLSIAGTATYQSDVVTIPLELPNIQIPSPTKDQYALYLEARQVVYDAGMTKARQELESVNKMVDLGEVMVSVEQTYNMVAEAYYSVLILNQRKLLLQTAGKELDATYQRMLAMYEEGAAPKASVLKIEAALTEYRQQLIEVGTLELQAMGTLTLLTGIEIDGSTSMPLYTITVPNVTTPTFNSAENKMFELRDLQLNANKALISNKRLPMVAAWGRAGYGRPGLNMLSDEFNPYFIVGATLSWEPWDWNRSKYELQTVNLRKKDLEARHDLYLNAQEISRKQLISAINMYPSLIEEANELVRIRSEIKESSAAALDEGAIATDDYISDFNDYISALHSLRMQKILASKAQVKYALLIGYPFK